MAMPDARPCRSVAPVHDRARAPYDRTYTPRGAEPYPPRGGYQQRAPGPRLKVGKKGS
eukprot:COSAG02_NODE_1583_length_11821_cov_31.279389_3_plen_58_part_00